MCFILQNLGNALKMDNQGPDITFLFQFGLIRDIVTVPQSLLTLKTIKDLACNFINNKVLVLTDTFVM